MMFGGVIGVAGSPSASPLAVSVWITAEIAWEAEGGGPGAYQLR